MDGQTDAARTAVRPSRGGRFCTNCGRTARHRADRTPGCARDRPTRPNGSTSPRLRRTSGPRRSPAPAGVPDDPGVPARRAVGAPARARDPACGSASRPRLVLVLVLGGFLLLKRRRRRRPGTSSTAADRAEDPAERVGEHQHVDVAVTRSLDELVLPGRRGAARRRGRASPRPRRPAHAPAGVDFAGRPVTYVAPNMVDGRQRHLLAHAGRRHRAWC